MAHFAILSLPYPSHVSALQALAGELLERDHRVSWVGIDDVLHGLHDPRLGRAVVGRRRYPAGALDALLARAARPGGPFGLRRVIRGLADTTAMLCEEAPALLAASQVDAVLADQMEAAGGLIAAALGLPWASVACALPVNREPALPLPVMPWPPAAEARDYVRNATSARVHDWFMAPLHAQIARRARDLNLPPRASLEDCLSPRLQLSQTPLGFDFPRRALPAGFHAVGPLRSPPAHEPPLHLLPRRDAPFVFASLGTLQGGRFGLFRRIAQACRELGAQLAIAHCGLLDAAQARALEAAGATWVTDFLPQRAVLARADALVTHGGLNTVLDALAAGTPMLALPIAFDQPGVAARLTHAGAGLVLSPRFASVRTLRRGLERLLGEPRFAERAEAIGAEVRGCGGARSGAALVERCLLAPAGAASTGATHAA